MTPKRPNGANTPVTPYRSWSGVERLDTAAAAVLVEVLVAGQQKELQVLICGSSLAIQRLFRLSGLDDALECCCETPAETKRRLTAAAPR